MFATAPLARAIAVTGAVLFASVPTLAKDRNDKSLPQFEFTLASAVPFTPTVANVLPPSLLAEAVATPAAPLAEAAQRPQIDLVAPRAGADLSTSLRRTMYVSFAALQIMDAVSTRKALSNGATEANPAMAGLARNSAAFFAVKAGTAAATTFFAERLAKRHPRRAMVMMAVLNTAYAAIVAHNYRVANR